MFQLTATQRETLRAKLSERCARLRGEIGHALHGSVAADELNAVLEALARMESGRYGLCSDCGAPIAFERLLAQPQASRCIRCETERERLRARPSLPAL